MQPEQIAAKLVGDEIRLLQQLQEMAGNPRVFDFMCRIVDAARNGKSSVVKPASPATKAIEADSASSAPNGLTEAVLKCCETMGTKITVAAVVKKMTAEGYVFVAQKPKVAVADVIRRYTGTNLKLTQRGTGNQPNIYKWSEEAGSAAA
jgi:hypothetical protein